MKKLALIILAAVCLGVLAAPVPAAEHNDFKVIQKAVKKNPAYERVLGEFGDADPRFGYVRSRRARSGDGKR